ncbi:hypothetical protein AB6A40_001746 [Gnathostoma spinigerum]|uniref:Uncharacterized protein n=1 Tax=Gnathostoma spinigerum TaxID=75299 RepID=A0ABD6EET4_9BILA
MISASAPPFPTDVRVESPTTRSGDLPPTYEDSTNPNAMPPTYESLYGEFQQVDGPKGLAQFAAKVFAVLMRTVTAAVLLAIFNIIPLGMIILGALNINNCIAEPYIPIWLIVVGAFSLLKSATNLYYRSRRQRSGQPPSPSDINPNPFDGLLSCFLLIWFIIGSVWIYSINDAVQHTNPHAPFYCDQFTFVFSFVFVTIGYILFAVFVFCCCCCCCCVFLRAKNQ